MVISWEEFSKIYARLIPWVLLLVKRFTDYHWTLNKPKNLRWDNNNIWQQTIFFFFLHLLKLTFNFKYSFNSNFIFVKLSLFASKFVTQIYNVVSFARYYLKKIILGYGEITSNLIFFVSQKIDSQCLIQNNSCELTRLEFCNMDKGVNISTMFSWRFS